MTNIIIITNNGTTAPAKPAAVVFPVTAPSTSTSALTLQLETVSVTVTVSCFLLLDNDDMLVSDIWIDIMLDWIIIADESIVGAETILIIVYMK